MNSVTVKNYRCFREEQQVRLAPLTLLVGENSTGKTSFLAMVRALREVAFESRVPDFQKPPYDLGTFSEIANNRGRRGADSFEAAFSRRAQLRPIGSERSTDESITFAVTFESRNGVPYPTTRGLSSGDRSLEVRPDSMRLTVSDRKATIANPQGLNRLTDDDHLVTLRLMVARGEWQDFPEEALESTDEKPYGSLIDGDVEEIMELIAALFRRYRADRNRSHTFAGAPVRSTPKRTYDPARPFQDPEGEYIPTLLVNISRRNEQEWEHLRESLEQFGKTSGLFNEIFIESLGKSEGSPFQLQVRKSGGRLKGRKRNLVDVGYGVSQVLPVLIEILHRDRASIFLLQQPEIHLHPTAQAALGSLFCQIASWSRQIIVETHSDYLLDRVRMDVRDKKTNLKPEDVSILYFEPDRLDVRIHSLELDEDGNILNAPSGYRQFFMEEMRRSIGL